MLGGGAAFAEAYDFNYWAMTDTQRAHVRTAIARIMYAAPYYGVGLAPEAITSNWESLNTFQLIMLMAMEGETSAGVEGFDTNYFNSYFTNAMGAMYGFLTYGWHPSGAKKITLNGQVTGAGGFKVIWDAYSVVLGSALNDFAGDITLGGSDTLGSGSTAIVQLGVDNTIPSGAGKGKIVFTYGAAKQGVLDLNSHNAQVNGLVSADNTGALVDNKSGSGSYTLTVGGNNASCYFGGVIVNTTGNINLTKTGAGTLTLSQTNSYSGSTLVNSGALTLSSYATIPTTPLIGIGGGAMLNVAGLTNIFTLAASQILSNSAAGTGVVCGNFNDTAGTNSFAYTNGMPCLLVTNGTFTLGAATVFKLNNVGPALLPGSYKLIARAATGTAGNVAGALPALSVNGVAAGATATLQFSSGELFLNVTATNPPVLGGIQLAGTNFILTGTNGIAGANFYVLAATNLILPMSNWTFIATQQFGTGGSLNFTNPFNPNSPQSFYRLRLP